VIVSTASEPQAADSDLVLAARDGDRAAFGSLYGRHKRMVHGVLLAHVSYGDAEDLMQDVFVQAMRSLPHLREASAFGGWLAAIARNLAIDHHRRRKNTVAIDERNAGTCRPDESPDESKIALDAIGRLPAAYRETLILRLVEGMTGPEIATRTGLAADSVRVNLCRGMKLLRAQLEGSGNDV
jgi:RNA polymerase sigma-70 factor, ECF subfamily